MEETIPRKERISKRSSLSSRSFCDCIDHNNHTIFIYFDKTNHPHPLKKLIIPIISHSLLLKLITYISTHPTQSNHNNSPLNLLLLFTLLLLSPQSQQSILPLIFHLLSFPSRSSPHPYFPSTPHPSPNVPNISFFITFFPQFFFSQIPHKIAILGFLRLDHFRISLFFPKRNSHKHSLKYRFSLFSLGFWRAYSEKQFSFLYIDI